MKGMKRVIFGTAQDKIEMSSNVVIMWAAGASSPTESDGIVYVTGQADLMVLEDGYTFLNSVNTATTYAASGIVAGQISSTLSIGAEFRYLDFEGNLITSGHRKVSETGDRTLSTEDFGKFIAVNKASDAVITIPTLPIGWYCYIQQESANPMTFVAGSGLSFLNPTTGKSAATNSRYSVVKVQMSRTNSCTLTGDLVDGKQVVSNATSYQLKASDSGKVIVHYSGSAGNITIPSGLGDNFSCTLVQRSTGALTVVASGTTIIGTAATTTAGDIKHIVPVATDTYAIGN